MFRSIVDICQMEVMDCVHLECMSDRWMLVSFLNAYLGMLPFEEINWSQYTKWRATASLLIDLKVNIERRNFREKTSNEVFCLSYLWSYSSFYWIYTQRFISSIFIYLHRIFSIFFSLVEMTKHKSRWVALSLKLKDLDVVLHSFTDKVISEFIIL